MRLSETFTAILRALREWRFYALLAASLILWGAAYQYKTEYNLNIGGLYDDAYVADFHGKERNPELNYRWSMGYSTILFPGIGNQPVEVTLTLIGFRPDGQPPQIEVEARGRRFTIQTTAAPQTHTFFLPRNDPWQGDLQIAISSPTFTDPRKLGVLVDRVSVRPADFGLRPVIVPPLGTLGGLLAGLVAVYFSIIVALRRVSPALAGVGLLSILFALLIVTARLEIGLLAPQLPVLGLWALSLAVASRVALALLLSGKVKSADFAVGAGALAMVAAFVLRFGGLTYPQFLTSDILLHAHNVQSVAGGEWVFYERLPDGTPVPYPPALYVLLAPFALLLGADDASISLHIKFAASLLDAACCLGLAWAGARLWGGLAGGLAALLYAFSPAPFGLFSAGNYTNLFAQSTLNLTLLAALVFLTNPPPIPRATSSLTQYVVNSTQYALLSLATGFALTMLGHYGMMLGALPIMAFFGLWALYAKLRGRDEVGRSGLVLAAFGGALLASFALYYWRFIADIWSQLSAVLRRFLGLEARANVPASGVTEVVRETFLERTSRRIAQLVGFEAALPALFGALLPIRQGAVRALTLSWLGAALLFFAVDQALGDAVRWYYLAAAPLALLAGRYLGQLAGRGRAGALLTALLISAALWHLLQIWVGDLIFTRYH